MGSEQRTAGRTGQRAGEAAVARELAGGLGVPGEAVAESPVQGVANRVWFLGPHLVLRIAREGFAADLEKEAGLLPAVVRAGVRTPEPVASGERDGRPYLVQRRAPGAPPALERPARAYRELGAQLALLHSRVDRSAVPPEAEVPEDVGGDPRAAVRTLAREGWIGPQDEDWLLDVLDRLHRRGAHLRGGRRVLVHGDAAPQNLLVRPDGRLSALLDWGDAAWSDPAVDFAKLVPGAAVEAVRGYLGAADGGDPAVAAVAAPEPVSEPDSEVEPEAEAEWAARILWFQLGWALGALTRRPVPEGGTFWCAAPGSRLLALLRAHSGPAGGRLPEAWRLPGG